MNKKTVLVTGGNSGIGLAIAHAFAERGARVCIASRNAKKSEAACESIRRATAGAEVEHFSLDLASFAAIRAFAQEFMGKHETLDVLVNNAGAYFDTERFTDDGFEWQFGANYLGPFLLTHLLLPALKRSDDARGLHMSSFFHTLGAIDPSTFRGRRPYFGTRAYAQSKLGNLLFSHALARRVRSLKITSNAMHPGGVDSPVYDDLPKWQLALLKPFLIGPERATKLALDLTLSAEHRETTGKYFSAHGPSATSPSSRNVELQESLYAQSCALTGVEPLA